jgi:class 3 adenylate cyclase
MTEINRKRAAIVSADVVGYARLMGVDQTGALAAFRAHRAELTDPKIAEHAGIDEIFDPRDDVTRQVVNPTVPKITAAELARLRRGEKVFDEAHDPAMQARDDYGQGAQTGLATGELKSG